jgi:hypothetical protein
MPTYPGAKPPLPTMMEEVTTREPDEKRHDQKMAETTTTTPTSRTIGLIRLRWICWHLSDELVTGGQPRRQRNSLLVSREGRDLNRVIETH